MLPKIRLVYEMIQQIKPGCEMEVDGGIDVTTAPLAVRAGANVLMAGSAIFGERDGVGAAMDRLRAARTKFKRHKKRLMKRSALCSSE
jgi:ribulose-phosphate 3-epimerase